MTQCTKGSVFNQQTSLFGPKVYMLHFCIHLLQTEQQVVFYTILDHCSFSKTCVCQPCLILFFKHLAQTVLHSKVKHFAGLVFWSSTKKQPSVVSSYVLLSLALHGHVGNCGSEVGMQSKNPKSGLPAHAEICGFDLELRGFDWGFRPVAHILEEINALLPECNVGSTATI